ncbi:MBL fold metallo-hydrolase [Hyalangium rubrum]|uniref:MBL fold metallo-hydrolase n=1 Tax=Hyalangium rubrum TaxID=3103134 RepID=A0ABU5H536_9BACT|nr:MBL fold metallo-hydrolase [Hyalangium sp. s54d21]MDY7228189.1 MBL fold metallo-hydrolase [Hyalangium sp. s54d21]
MSSSPRKTRKQKPADKPLREYRARESARRVQAAERASKDGAGKVPFHVRFWGVRGSIPSPGPHTRIYGGNTPCVEMRVGDELLVFDLGTGALPLGDSLLASGKPVQASVFLSHYHYDHLQGLPFFKPIFVPQNGFTFYGAPRNGQSVKQILSGQMTQPYFPVTAEGVFRAQLSYHDIQPGSVLTVGPARVRTVELNHPGGNLGYRVECEGRSVVYATDIEHSDEENARFFEFARGADLLIYDSMYTEDEYCGRHGPPRTGWGHSTFQAAVHAANECQAKTLVLFHHDPGRDDASMNRMLRQVRKHRPEAIAAKEDMVLKLP